MLLRDTGIYLRLRWRFDFHGKNPKIGQWSRDADREEEKAAFVNKTGLVRAAIETKSIMPPYDVRTIAECDGWDFVNFKWFTVAASLNARGPVRHETIGLILVTREIETVVYRNGETVVRSRTAEDKQFHYAGFGR